MQRVNPSEKIEIEAALKKDGLSGKEITRQIHLVDEILDLDEKISNTFRD